MTTSRRKDRDERALTDAGNDYIPPQRPRSSSTPSRTCAKPFAMTPDHEPGRVACVLLTKDNGRYANALAGAVLRSKLTVKEAAAKSVRFAEDCMKDKAGATKSPCP